MKILLDIEDDKASSLVEVLQGLSYVKMKTITPYKANVLEDIQIAVEQVNLIQSGKLKGREAKELFDEL